CDLYGPVVLRGLVAGGDATASVVVADGVHVARRLAVGYPVPPPRENGPEQRLLPMAEVHFFFSSRRRHTRSKRDWSSDVCSSDLSSARAPRPRAPSPRRRRSPG